MRHNDSCKKVIYRLTRPREVIEKIADIGIGIPPPTTYKYHDCTSTTVHTIFLTDQIRYDEDLRTLFGACTLFGGRWCAHLEFPVFSIQSVDNLRIIFICAVSAHFDLSEDAYLVSPRRGTFLSQLTGCNLEFPEA